jgi:predicted naringenin-chalcone synthase
MTNPAIQAIGTAVPPHRISQQLHMNMLASAEGLSRADRLVIKKIYSHSGIDYRHSVLGEFGEAAKGENAVFTTAADPDAPVSRRMKLYEQYAAGLCMEAATACLEQLPGLQRSAITHVVAFSCTGLYAPGLDVQLTQMLGLPNSVERTCINFMGCYAAINALKSAYHICRSQPEAVVLLAGAELCSLHYQKSSDPNQIVANALFADGAAAVVVSARSFIKTGSIKLQLCEFYAGFEAAAAAEMVWRIGDAAFDLRLTPEVPKVVKNNIGALLQKLFDKTGLQPAHIDHYAIHPGGVKILEACEAALPMTKEQNGVSYQVLKDYGNMSSVTVLFVLQHYMETLTPTDTGKKILACAFGPGITMESMIVEVAG